MRVYVLLLEGGRMYVGIVPTDGLQDRLKSHWERKGSAYTKRYKPEAVLMVWPAAHRGVEGYVFQALLSQLERVNVGDYLGGWVQTDTELNPLKSMVFEEQRRQVREVCFRCGFCRSLCAQLRIAHWNRPTCSGRTRARILRVR